jgi:lipoate-protein ligase B
VNKELLGLWHDHQNKLASIGLAITRFVTYHGLALNFLNDDEMFQSIKSVHPCGLPGNVYTSVEKLSNQNLSFNDLDEFIKLFSEEFLHLMIDKQISSASINFEISP